MNKQDFESTKAYPLSNSDILELIDLEPTNIFSSDKLLDVIHIDELLDRKGRGIMLYLTENEQTGHWVGLLKKNNTIEIFDPYGFNPKDWEEELGAVKDLNPSMKELEKLIKKSGYKMVFNKKRHQPLKLNNNSCGKHTVMRLLFHKFSLDEYNNLMKKFRDEYNITSDDLANGFSLETIGK
jgi:hypothetical protein